jgi:hypothetical protein
MQVALVQHARGGRRPLGFPLAKRPADGQPAAVLTVASYQRACPRRLTSTAELYRRRPVLLPALSRHAAGVRCRTLAQRGPRVPLPTPPFVAADKDMTIIWLSDPVTVALGAGSYQLPVPVGVSIGTTRPHGFRRPPTGSKMARSFG